MASYAVRVKRDIGRWLDQGLITPAVADQLARDVEAHQRRSVSFGTILAILAAILFAAALLLVVAANWEAIPRLYRAGLLFAVIAAGYVGGAFLKQAGHSAFAEALWLIAAAAFGGAIALIGQMYHLSGDEADAILTWCFATALAAAALRSGVLNAAAVGLADAWMFMGGVTFWDAADFPTLFPVLAAGLWVLSYWTNSAATRHLILPSLVIYLVMLAIDHDMVAISLALAVVSAGAFAAGTFRAAETDGLLKLDGRLPLHALIGFLAGMTMVQFQVDGTLLGLIVAAAMTFAGIAAALLAAGRDSRGVRWLAYLGFAGELCFVYAVTLGTMLGTAGFFLAVAVILGLLAFLIIRFERRLGAGPAAVGAAS